MLDDISEELGFASDGDESSIGGEVFFGYLDVARIESLKIEVLGYHHPKGEVRQDGLKLLTYWIEGEWLHEVQGLDIYLADQAGLFDIIQRGGEGFSLDIKADGGMDIRITMQGFNEQGSASTTGIEYGGVAVYSSEEIHPMGDGGIESSAKVCDFVLSGTEGAGSELDGEFPESLAELNDLDLEIGAVGIVRDGQLLAKVSDDGLDLGCVVSSAFDLEGIKVINSLVEYGESFSDERFVLGQVLG